MKLKLGLLSLVVGLVVLSSCKKDYRCTCTQNGVYFTHFEYQNMEEEGAVAACASDEYLQQNENADPSITCSID